MGHKVRAFHWNKGHLRVQERHFDSLESAQAFLADGDLDLFEAKIYNDGDELVHHAVVDSSTDTYA
jgi:hypothetical protein